MNTAQEIFGLICAFFSGAIFTYSIYLHYETERIKARKSENLDESLEAFRKTLESMPDDKLDQTIKDIDEVFDQRGRPRFHKPT